LRGITIDLGFAHLSLGDLHVGFVDVPGHEKFVKNMLAGVGGIDLVLLVVAADESIMPQTREHFDICRLLGVQAGIAVITKIDLIEPEMVELVIEEVQDAIRGSFLEKGGIIPVSARTGQNLDRLKNAIRELAQTIPLRPTSRPLRLPIDRAFTMRGFGTVVTGTLTTGSLAKEDEVELIPGKLMTRVRSIQVHGATVATAVAGQRTAVNLQGIDLSQVERGTVLTAPRLFSETQMVDVRLNLLPTARTLKNFTKVRFHHDTSEVLGRIALLGIDSQRAGTSAYAQIRFDRPTFCLHGDPFIVRQFSPMITIGGGRILHPQPLKHRGGDESTLADLKELDAGSLPEKLLTFLRMHPRQMMALTELNSLLGVAESDLRRTCSELAAALKIVWIAAPIPLLVCPDLIETLERQTHRRVEEFHAQNSLQKGISREELRKRVYDNLPLELFRHCLDDMVSKRKITLQEEMVAAFGREVQLSAQAEQLRVWIEERYQEAGFQPPSLSELWAAAPSNPELVRQICHWLLKEKILVKVSEDLAFHRSTLDQLKTRIQSTFAAGTRFGVAEFKELLDITRKHAIPLLEYLDRERITRRQGNERILM
jgi:selenocysteine-specific elongation factor